MKSPRPSAAKMRKMRAMSAGVGGLLVESYNAGFSYSFFYFNSKFFQMI